MYRRRMLSICGVLTGGISVVGSARSADPRQTSKQTGYRFTGSGPALTDAFTLEDGVTTVEFDHDGESTFRTELVAISDTESNDPLVEGRGPIKGGRAIVTRDDTYVLEITADRAWTIECEQPVVDGLDPDTLPYTDSGSGVDYTGPVLLTRRTELTTTHYGDSSVSIWAYTADGNRNHLVETSGTVERRTGVRIDGPTWFDVDADGEWTLELR